MISIKRNKNGMLVSADGIRGKRWIYSKEHTQFKISRGKFDDFLACPRCFYLDRVKGLKSPSLPGWSLNTRVDELLKVEFDKARAKHEAHYMLKDSNLEHIIPLDDPNIDKYRDSLHHGIQYQIPDTNILLTGGVDDLWFNTQNKKVVVLDYKAQAKDQDVETESYLSNIHHIGYKRQLDFYAYLLTKNGYEVDDTGYFYVCNAYRCDQVDFDGRLSFYQTLVPYELDMSWIDVKLDEMVDCLNRDSIPEETESCENCAFNRELINIINEN